MRNYNSGKVITTLQRKIIYTTMLGLLLCVVYNLIHKVNLILHFAVLHFSRLLRTKSEVETPTDSA